jgi:predicted dithiol-disulfide oxidoreductase (DUF899 family)
MVVVYRGRHCPICRTYLKSLDGLYDEFRAGGTEVVAVSGDPREKAESEAAEEGWRFPVGYGLTRSDAAARPLHFGAALAAGDRPAVPRAGSVRD